MDISHVLGTSEMQDALNSDGPVGGTPSYSSPSTIAAHQAVNADLHAVHGPDLSSVAYRYAGQTRQAASSIDPSVKPLSYMGELALHEAGVAPRQGPLGTFTEHGAGPDGRPVRTPGTRPLGTTYNLGGD